MNRRVRVGAAADFQPGDRRLVEVDGQRIGVFRLDDGFVAYLNVCPHQGGPVCEGRYFPRVEAEVAPDGRLVAERSVRSAPHLVCPWHGWEYDLRTGVMPGEPSIRLRAYDVPVEDGIVYVAV